MPINNEKEFLNNTSKFNSTLALEVSKGFKQKVQKTFVPEMAFQLGYNVKKIKFENHYVFQDRNNQLTIFPDSVSSHSYPNKLFKKGFSRLSGKYIRLGSQVGFSVGNFLKLKTGPLLDLNVGAKHKRKWFEDGKKMKEVLSGNDVLKLNKVNIGWDVSLHLYSLQFSYTFFFNNFFKKDWGLNTRFNAFGVGIVVSLE